MLYVFYITNLVLLLCIGRLWDSCTSEFLKNVRVCDQEYHNLTNEHWHTRDKDI